jgi:1,4-alpha-glucan branching enzyme
MNSTLTMTKRTRNRTAPRNSRHPGDDQQRPLEVEVLLEFIRPAASTVFVAGTFNEWHPAVTPMIAIAEGRWIKQLRLRPGRYEYCLVVDGEWMPDPLATESVPNPFGGFNSVLQVAAND